MEKEKRNSFLGGAAILAAAIVVVKVIGAFFKIPIVNILGDGYADFSNAYNIYALLLTVSTAGLPVALSKMVAAADALGREGQVRRIFRVSLAVFATLGLASFLVMFFGNAWLAELLHDTKAAQSIRYLAPAVVCVSLLSSFRGYAQGHSHMTPSAVSQVIEAAGKLLIGLPLAYLSVRAGQADDQAAAMAILGVTLGSALALAYMVIQYALHRRRLDDPQSAGAPGDILRELLVIAVPITLTSSAVSIINLIDSALVQGQLQSALGLSEDQSRNLYTAYSGVMTIYNLPSSLILSITASIIPAVSSALARGRRADASRVVRAAYHITALLVFPMGVGMCVLATPIVELLLHRLDPQVSGPLLAVLGIASIFVCLVAVSHAIMQAHGFQHLPVLIMSVAGVVKILVNYNLVPFISINGAPIGTLCCFGLACVLDFVVILRIVPKPPNFFRLFFGPALAAGVMALAAWGVHALLHGLLGNTLATVLAILAAVAVYGALVVCLRLLSRDELRLMPKGDKLADLLRLP